MEMQSSPIKDDEETVYSPNHILESNVLFQLEYQFGDDNLQMDNYLLSRMHEEPDHWVSVKTVANLTKIKAWTDDERVVLRAIKKSKMLVLNEDETKVKRAGFEPPQLKQHKDLRRTVFVYELPANVTKEDVIRLCSSYGEIKSVVLDHCPNTPSIFDSATTTCSPKTRSAGSPESYSKPEVKEKGKEERNEEEEEGREANDHHDSIENVEEEIEPPDRETAEFVMRKKYNSRVNQVDREAAATVVTIKETDGTISNDLNDNNTCEGNGRSVTTPPFSHFSGKPCDVSNLRTAFVVFKSQSQAIKCVRAGMQSNDGFHAMHQYDFNKQRKKASVNRARGMSPFLKEFPHQPNLHSPSSSSRCGQSRLSSPFLGPQSQNVPDNKPLLEQSLSQNLRDNRDRNGYNSFFSSKRRFQPRFVNRNERLGVANTSVSDARSHPSYNYNRHTRYYRTRNFPTKLSRSYPNWRNLSKPRNDSFEHYSSQILDKESTEQIMAAGPDYNGSKGFNWPRNHIPRDGAPLENVANVVPIMTQLVFCEIPGTGIGVWVALL